MGLPVAKKCNKTAPFQKKFRQISLLHKAAPKNHPLPVSFSGAEWGALPAGLGRDPEQGHPHEQSRKRNRGRAPRLHRIRARDAVTFFGNPFLKAAAFPSQNGEFSRQGPGETRSRDTRTSRRKTKSRQCPPPLQDPGKRRYKVFWQTFFSKKVCGTIGAGGMPFFTTISRNRGQYSR